MRHPDSDQAPVGCPELLVSSAPAVKIFSMKSGSQVLASAIGCGKRMASLSHVAVQDFVMKDRRNSQTRVFNQPLLYCVCKDGSIARPLLLPLLARSARSIFHCLRGFPARSLRDRLRKSIRGFFCGRFVQRHVSCAIFSSQRHAREKIGHALFDGKARIFVSGNLFLGSSLVCWLGTNDQDQQRQGKEEAESGRSLSVACALFFFICSREIQQLHRSVPTSRRQIQVQGGTEHCFDASPGMGI